MLNNIVIGVIVALLVAIGALYCTAKHFYTKCKTTNSELERLRNKYNGLQQDYEEYKYAMKHKEELYEQTQQQLAQIADADDATVIEQLQHRSDRVRHEDSGT